LTYGNSLYVYAGSGGVLRTSTDATTIVFGQGYNVVTEFKLPTVSTTLTSITLTTNAAVVGTSQAYIKAL
jgi:hypothetical protein